MRPQRDGWGNPPNGGTPPAAIGVKLSGTKPSLNDARPFWMPICEAVGIELTYPAPAFLANGRGMYVGTWLASKGRYSSIYVRYVAVARTPTGFGSAPELCTIETS